MSLFSQKFEPYFTDELPGNRALIQHPTHTPASCWSKAIPTKVSDPTLLDWFEDVAQQVGFSNQAMQSRELLDILSGNASFPDVMPYSACYGGHQFGHWAGQLGDGRAITIAEITHRNKRWDLQLKGAGLTPYSRTADGRAVLRSSIREYLCSQAMYHLNIPTTQALSLILTGDDVIRDMLYSGDPQPEPGAIVCRVSPSFIRFGNFEIHAAREEHDILKQLIHVTMARDFPSLSGTQEQKVQQWFQMVCESTAKLMVEWQRVGFVHGVMNTDNMSILGLTLDYGPYGWLDNYDPDWTPNTTDAQNRRYRFSNQPAIARWNLICLANALATVYNDLEIYRQGLNRFDSILEQDMLTMQFQKFGLQSLNSTRSESLALIHKAYDLMHKLELDFTLFFRFITETTSTIDEFKLFCYRELTHKEKTELLHWLDAFNERIDSQNLNPIERQTLMNQANPQFILRNYLVQIAIEKAESGDYSELKKLKYVLQKPYSLAEKDKAYALKRPDWAKTKVGCSMLSCSS